jgi:hypothetical protein
MADRELYIVREYNHQLIDASHNESQYRSLRPARPSWLDYLLLRLGNSLIVVGQKIKTGSSFAQSTNIAELSQECT